MSKTQNKFYKNTNIQIRLTTDQKWYWEVRPFGNPRPTKCHFVDGFISEKITFSDDQLVKTVETCWKSKDHFLACLPPDVFEQPQFQEWHDLHKMTFSVKEEWVEIKEKNYSFFLENIYGKIALFFNKS